MLTLAVIYGSDNDEDFWSLCDNFQVYVVVLAHNFFWSIAT